MEIETLLKLSPYELNKEAKRAILLKHLTRLTIHHIKYCKSYRNILSALNFTRKNIKTIEDFPFLPVRLFKDFELKSTKDSEPIKTLTSSGTTSQKVSKIFLDKKTSIFQTKVLVNIVQDFIGNKRLPMIIADSRSTIKNVNSYSARGAGIIGMSNFGRNHFYLLDENMEMDFEGLENFLKIHQKENILIFGFTYMVWQYVYKNILDTNKTYDLSRAILIHSGGWKKLLEEAVDNNTFKSSLENVCGISKIHNFYGMVEQTGSIFMECELGHLHTPNFADVIVRDPLTWSSSLFSEEGVIQVISILPYSYPGHILLTDDIGKILGEDDCACGRYGKYFSVKGRIPKAEIRGCSDTHAYKGNINGL